MSDPLAFINGVYVPMSQAALPLTDMGFVNGATVTDNCRTWNRKLFRWADHLARFRRDCEACFVPLPHDDAAITAIAHRLLESQPDDVHVVTFATPQSFGMFTRPVDLARNRRFRDHGVHLRVVGYQPVDAGAVLSPAWKHRSRMVWHIADHLAKGAVAVLTDREGGTLTETAIGNVLAVIDGALITPPRCLLLDGISLRVTLELATSLGIPWCEREIRPEDRMSEMLLAGTGFGLAAVSKLDDRDVNWPGPVFQQLAEAWRASVT